MSVFLHFYFPLFLQNYFRINKSPHLNEFVRVIHNYAEQRIVTVQDQKTTLKKDQSIEFEDDEDRYANNYDHFTYDESILGKCDILQCRRVNGAKYMGNKFEDYKKVISDHMPILIELDIRGGSR